MKLKILIVLMVVINVVLLRAQPKDGLIAHWTFDEVINGYFKDVTGNGNDARISGNYQLDNGVLNKCYKLNGNTFAVLANQLFMDGTCNITFATWFKIDGDNYGRYLLFSTSDDYRSTYDPFSMEIWEGRPFDLSFEDTKSNKAIRVDHNNFPFRFQKNKWYHFIAQLCFDGNYSNLKIYVDGKLVQEVNELTVMTNLSQKIGKGKCCVVYDKPMPSIIGALNDFSPWNFIGCLDEMMFYNRCLTDEEIIKFTTECKDLGDSIKITGTKNTTMEYDSVKTNTKICKKYKIQNITNKEVILNYVNLKYSNAYEITPGQLPLTIPGKSTKELEICFLPQKKGVFIDTLIISNKCSELKSLLIGYGKEPCRDLMDSISIEGLDQQLFFDTVDINVTKCLKFKILNKTDKEKSITKIRLKNDLDYSLSSNTLPIIIPPNGEKEVEICFKPLKKGIYTDSLEIYNDCSAYKYFLKGYGKDPCVDILDSISIEGLNTTLFYDSVDTKTTKCLKFKITNKSKVEKRITTIKLKMNTDYTLSSNTFPIIIPPYGEKEVEVCFKPKTKGTFIDSLEIFNNCSSYKYELKGYGRSDCVELYDMLSIEYIDSSKTVVIPDTRVADTKTIKCRIYNYSNSKVKLDEAFFAINQSFSFPHAQLPVYIEAKSYFELIVYYKPSQYGTERDTLILNNDCSNIRIPFVSRGLHNEFLGESKCEAIIKAEGVRYSDPELIFYPPYPNPTKSGFYINYIMNSNISRTVTIDFCNTIGECNNQILIKLLPGSNIIKFDSELLNDGYNILRIKERDELKTFIIIKE